MTKRNTTTPAWVLLAPNGIHFKKAKKTVEGPQRPPTALALFCKASRARHDAANSKFTQAQLTAEWHELNAAKRAPFLKEAAATLKVYRKEKASFEQTRKYPCGGCGENVEEDNQAILCEYGCSAWFHLSCTALTSDAYDHLAEFEEGAWMCRDCFRQNIHPKESPRKPASPRKAIAALPVKQDIAEQDHDSNVTDDEGAQAPPRDQIKTDADDSVAAQGMDGIMTVHATDGCVIERGRDTINGQAVGGQAVEMKHTPQNSTIVEPAPSLTHGQSEVRTSIQQMDGGNSGPPSTQAVDNAPQASTNLNVSTHQPKIHTTGQPTHPSAALDEHTPAAVGEETQPFVRSEPTQFATDVHQVPQTQPQQPGSLIGDSTNPAQPMNAIAHGTAGTMHTDTLQPVAMAVAAQPDAAPVSVNTSESAERAEVRQQPGTIQVSQPQQSGQSAPQHSPSWPTQPTPP